MNGADKPEGNSARTRGEEGSPRRGGAEAGSCSCPGHAEQATGPETKCSSDFSLSPYSHAHTGHMHVHAHVCIHAPFPCGVRDVGHFAACSSAQPLLCPCTLPKGSTAAIPARQMLPCSEGARAASCREACPSHPARPCAIVRAAARRSHPLPGVCLPPGISVSSQAVNTLSAESLLMH